MRPTEGRDRAAEVLPDQDVVLCTQAADAASVRLARRLGFVEVARFEEFGAEQWYAARPLAGPAQRRSSGGP